MAAYPHAGNEVFVVRYNNNNGAYEMKHLSAWNNEVCKQNRKWALLLELYDHHRSEGWVLLIVILSKVHNGRLRDMNLFISVYSYSGNCQRSR